MIRRTLVKIAYVELANIAIWPSNLGVLAV